MRFVIVVVNLETINAFLKSSDNNQNSSQGHSEILGRKDYNKRENLINFTLSCLDKGHVNQRGWPI